MSFLRQAVHIVMKDVLRFGPYLVILLALLAGSALWLMRGEPAVPAEVLTYVVGFALGIFAAVVVVEDTPVSETAFWATRAFNPGAVLAGKLALVGVLLVLVPALLQAVWLAGFDQMEVSALLSQTLVAHGGWMALVVLGASLMRDSRDLPVALVIGAVLLLTHSFVESTMGDWWPTSQYRPQSARLFLRIGWLVLAIPLLIHHYATRRSLRTAAVALLALGLLYPLAVRASSGGPDPGIPQPASWAYADSDSVAVELLDISRRLGHADSARVRGELLAAVRIFSPEGVAVQSTRVQARLVTRGTGAGDWAPDGVSMRFRDLRSLDGFGGLAGGSVLLNGSGSGHQDVALLLIQDEHTDLSRRLESSSAVDIALELDVFGLRELERQAIDPGLVYQGPEARRVVRSVGAFPNGIRITIRNFSVGIMMGRPNHGLVPVLALVNPGRGELLLPATTSVVLSSGVSLAAGAGLRIADQEYFFTTEGTRSQAESVSLPQDWFDEAEIVFLGLDYRGTVKKTKRVLVDRWPEVGERVRFDPPM